MIQVLIISSLYSQTQHLRRILLGQAGHIQLCGTADNSVLGMSLIESLHPDVVIMPVHMTFWNPEDLINYLLPRGICPRFVLLSDGAEAVIEGAAAVKVQQLLPDAMPSDAMLLHAVEEACRGGATLIQLREKETGGRAYLELAQQVKAVTDRFQVPLIIDDRVDVAIACDAAGVHVGASDLPVAVCRKLLGPDKIVGATAKSVEAAKAAYEDGADYLGTGAIFPTTTHVTTKVTPVSVLNDVCRAVPIPVVAIGGLNADNMDVLSESPIAGVAVVSAVMKAADPAAAAAHIKEKFDKMRTK